MCRSSPSTGSRRSGSIRARTTASSSSPLTPRSTTTSWSRRPGSSSTCATRPAGTAPRTGKSSSCDQGGPHRLARRRRPRAVGKEPRAELRRAGRGPLALRYGRRAPRRVRLPLPERPRDGRVRRCARGRRRRGGRRRHARPDALRLCAARARGGQACLRREASGDARSRDGGALRTRRGAWPPAHAGAPPPLPPGCPQAEGARRLGRARRRALHLRQPSEPRHDPHQRERPVVTRRPRPVGAPPPGGGGAVRALGARQRLPESRRRGRRLLLPPLPLREDRPHAPLVARPAQDPADHRRRPGQDGRVRRHGARAQGHDLRQGARAADENPRRVADADGRHLQPQDPEYRAVAAGVRAFPAAPRGRGGSSARGARRPRGRACARAAPGVARSRRRLTAEIAPSAIVYPGTVLGDGCKILDGAVVGKQPTLSPRSTAKREDLSPADLGPDTVVSTGAIVFAGARIGARVIVGDQACVRERVTIGDDVVIGRGSLIENDTTVGALTKIQAMAYITAYSTLEDEVFIAPCVQTTNDNFMGRTEQRHALVKGPTIRRGARIGGGAVRGARSLGGAGSPGAPSATERPRRRAQCRTSFKVYEPKLRVTSFTST